MKLLPIVILLLLIGCKSDTKTTAATDITNAASTVQSAVKTASTTKITEVGGLSDEVSKATDDIKNQVAEAANTAKAQAETMVKETSTAVTEKADKVKAAAYEVQSKAKDKMDNVASDVKQKAQTATKTATKSIPKPVQEVTKQVEQVKTEKVATKAVPKPTKPEAVEKVESVPTKAKSAAKISHDDFDKLLSKYVSATGKVNYSGFKSSASKLDSYIAQLEATKVSDLSKNEQLAFWINAYNAHTIKKVISNYPLKSIKDLDGGKPWDAKWINLNGKTLSLNNIENDIIRPTFNEPRIHFAVNCAAKSCPPLLNKAWTASNLESNFTKTAKAFINSSENNVTADKAQLSNIFNWYAGDFGDIITFINKYSNVKVNAGSPIEYLDYNWALNE